jgi:hypothetical protein
MMKLFGTVQSFDAIKGQGEIKPETGGDPIHFEKERDFVGQECPSDGRPASFV